LIGSNNVSTFPAAMKLVRELRQLSILVNSLLKEVDPGQHAAFVQLNECLNEKYPGAATLRALDPLLPVGRSIIFNRATPMHKDFLDPVQGWAILIALGTAKGAVLHIPKLGIRIKYDPGTIIFIRGHLLEHEVEMFDGNQRITVAFFTHSSIFNEFGIVLPHL
jgi:hypothetical protein